MACLLALALPFQGAMAAGMLACGPQHHEAAPADVHARHGHAQAHSHEATQAADPAAAQQATAACSACASCCTGAALPTAVPGFGTSDPSGLEAAAPAPALTGVVPTRLERPPRSLFA